MKKIFFALILLAPTIISSMSPERNAYESRADRIARMQREAQHDPLLHEAFIYAAVHTLEKNSEYIPLEDARYREILKKWGITDQINYMPLGIHRILRLQYAPKIQKMLVEQAAQEEAAIRIKIGDFYTESELDTHMQDALAHLVLHALKNSATTPFSNSSYIELLQSEKILNHDGCLSPLAHKILCTEYAHLAQKLIVEQKTKQKLSELRQHIKQCYLSTDADDKRAFVLAFYHTEKFGKSVPMPKHRCNKILQEWGFIDSNEIFYPEVYDTLKKSYRSSTGLRTGYFVFPLHDQVDNARVKRIEAMIQAQHRQ